MYEEMDLEFNNKYLKTFNNPLPVAYFAFRSSIGYDWSDNFKTLNDFIDKD